MGGGIDEGALAALVESVLAAGVTAVSVLGSTGEGALVPAAARRRLVEATLRLVAGRVPVIAGSAGGPLVDASNEARAWVEMGADCVLASPPSYFQLDQADVIEYYGEFAGRVAAPIIVYHFPALTKLTLEPETVAVLAGIANIVGLKDSGGDGAFLRNAVSATAGAGFAILAGSGRVASFASDAGARGLLAASANLIPSHLVSLWAALQAGRRAEAAKLQDLVTAIETACREHRFPINWKAAVAWRGLNCGRPAPPLRELSAGSCQALGQSLARLLPVTAPR